MSGLIEDEGQEYRVLNGYAFHVQNGLNYFESSGEREARLKEVGYVGTIPERVDMFHVYGRQRS